MYLGLSILIFSAFITLGLRPSFAEDKKATSISNWPIKDSDIYIDDGLEGSGNNQEMREDLESSGSGFGPDDEDGTEDDPEEKHKDKGSKPTLFNNKEDQSRNILPVNTRTNIEVPDIDIENTNSITNTVQKEEDSVEVNRHGNGVIVMNTKHEERATSFFAQPGILAAVIGGAVVGLLCAILVVMFIVYRMRKKDEGSYALDEPKRSPTSNSYSKNSNREFYA
ncbi:syndecan isoform X3 [Cimex lectularius]|uniref:Syndecan n=1 Tax=Cimex lectularius TaxID=79782 RepID=A0A8I6RBW7_CIMLE|nr:syndecan isoform X3 [Cimex lectularius]